MKRKLTTGQLSLWAGQKIHPDAPLYNTACSYDIRGKIDLIKFKKALQTLLNSTDAFRIRFSEEEGIPYQYVRETVDFDLPLIDFSPNPDTETISKWLLQRSQLPLVLSDRVFDSALLKIDENRYVWYLNMHHLVTDGVSRKIVFKRMSSLYAALLNETTVTPGADIPSFLEYVEAEQERTNPFGPTSGANAINGSNSKEMPAFYGVKSEYRTTEATRIPIRLGSERSVQLKALLRHPDLRGFTEQQTLFTILSGLLFVFMYRVSNQRRLVLGAPLHNRVSRKFRETVGYFIEVYPLRTEVREDDTFRTLLSRVRRDNNESLKNALQPTIEQGEEKNFNAVLNFIHTSFPDFNGFETISQWIYTGHIDSKHQIRCHVMDYDPDSEIRLFLDLNHGTFDEELIQRVPHHFLRILDALLRNLDTTIGKPALPIPEERQFLLHKNSAFLETLPNIVTSFENIAVKHPNAVALQSSKEAFTYADLNKKSNQLAHYLRKKGVNEDDKVALYFQRGSEYIISVLGVLKTGGAFVPIATDQALDRIAYILSDSGCSLVLTEKSLRQKLGSVGIPVLALSEEKHRLSKEATSSLGMAVNLESLAYILYTSGSTGRPKGVLITHAAISNYLNWAGNQYRIDKKSVFPLFTSIGFDLTLTSTFLPLMNGGRIIVYEENNTGPDMAFLQVIDDNLVNVIKLTPSHLALLQKRNLSASHVETMIVGGEDFKVLLAKSIASNFPKDLKIYNEYGPTEATVGCIVGEFDIEKHNDTSVPIGKPIANMQAFVLDKHLNLVPKGVIGELYLSGTGLAKGYLNADEMTATKFVDHPFTEDGKMYHTGDLARINATGDFEYLGRIDDQVKLRGYRIELSDIEANLTAHPAIDNCAVVLVEDKKRIQENEVVNCIQCGLPSNYPNIDFNEQGICQLCTAFLNYEEKVKRYFKNDDELVRILSSKRDENPKYDCISLLSGGKDSTYVLARLVNMGLNVLAFTMDNGYISDQAKANVDRIVTKLGVDHVYGATPHMDEIFVDSLHRHHNVCNGCFKTIYTLSTQLALEKGIPFIVTGLSRGQFFETRLTEELFWDDALDTVKIDDTILEARKLYHRESDAVKRLLDVSVFEDDAVFEKVQFVDFYRYSDVSLEELLAYLKDKIGWVRPTDTGRSTNCLINQVGIYVHKKEEGYSNYAFPYSWDVRLGHKSRDESLEEINESIDEPEVKRIMDEIGYESLDTEYPQSERLVAYFTGNRDASVKDLKKFLSERLPYYMIPTIFKPLDTMPLTKNGKVDKNSLKKLNSAQLALEAPYSAPTNEIEELLERIWKEVLQLQKVGIYDDFIALGGHSLAAIRVTARINEEVETEFPLNKIFEHPTIAEYANYIEETLTALLENS
ncbi:amino acid adenylation domain-containing protein [Pricia sp. S334]|uniref:Amino acid adenylation domain-containing protein n=1 Tax=Pricia mediterranea TaxID=3076079 RepID=A0ABU3L210_9FLAO|nr:amino acid adenylation domain-containing protein [Pricia sp. S334]MDT7827318.1 amino acid adenylation domain-containing protein [Pricia sp. S334]